MKLFCRTYGTDGPPLIILHGLFGLSDNWVSIGRHFSDRFRVFIPDMRNHGLSPHSRVFNFFSMVEDLTELIEEHNLQNPIILGHSMGGKLAMIYSLMHADGVDKLIIADIGPVSYPTIGHGRLLQAMSDMDLQEIRSRNDAALFLQQRLNNDQLVQFVLKNLKQLSRGQFAWKPNLTAISENIVEVFGFPSFQNSYNGPTLFIAGGQSEYILPEHMMEIARLFPNAKLKRIENSGHWIHADNPKAFIEILESFLA